MTRRTLALTALVVGLFGAGSAAAETIVPSYPVEVGPVSTSTPAIERHDEDESFWESTQECLEDPQVSPTSVGCPTNDGP